MNIEYWIFNNKTTDTNTRITFCSISQKSLLRDSDYYYISTSDRSDSRPGTLRRRTVADVAGVLGGLHLLQDHVTTVLAQPVHLQQLTKWTTTFDID